VITSELFFIFNCFFIEKSFKYSAYSHQFGFCFLVNRAGELDASIEFKSTCQKKFEGNDGLINLVLLFHCKKLAQILSFSRIK
jgi:hypothetical protein